MLNVSAFQKTEKIKSEKTVVKTTFEWRPNRALVNLLLWALMTQIRKQLDFRISGFPGFQELAGNFPDFGIGASKLPRIYPSGYMPCFP